MDHTRRRLEYLDGLRGVAISLVLIFHYFSATYAEWLPYGAAHADKLIVRHGWMGVEIFFLISGYVIFMTIERCAGFRDFLMRRWLRLWPAMLIASIILFGITLASDLPGPFANPRTPDLIPGLLLVAPSVIHALTGANLTSLDGVLWTLYVEAAFYIFFGALYFAAGWRTAVLGLIASFVLLRLSLWGLPLVHTPRVLMRVFEPFQWLGFQYFGWFASGALFYKAHANSDRRLACAAIFVGLLAMALFSVPVGVSTLDRILLTGVVLGFAAAGYWRPLQRLLAFRPLLFVGAISYPLYLVHSNLGVGLTALFASAAPRLPAEVGVVPTVIIVIAIAWLITKYLEPPLRAQLKAVVDRVAQRMRQLRPAREPA